MNEINQLLIFFWLTFWIVGFLLFFSFHYYISYFYRKPDPLTNDVFATRLIIKTKRIEGKIKKNIEFDAELRFFTQTKYSWNLFCKLWDNQNRNKLNRFVNQLSEASPKNKFIKSNLSLWFNKNPNHQKIYLEYQPHLSQKNALYFTISNIPIIQKDN